MARSGGFSLLELLVTLSIVGILVGVAVSGYTEWVYRTKTVETAFALQRSLSQARSEAIKYGGRVRLCGSTDGASCTPSLNEGWIVFLDTNRSNQVDGDETVISLFRQEDDSFEIDLADGPGGTSIEGVTFNFRGYSDRGLAAVVKRQEISEEFSMSRSGMFE